MSSTGVQKNPITLQATAAEISAYKVVKLDSNGLMSLATAINTEAVIGLTIKPVATSGYGAVDLFNAGGTAYVTLNATVTKGDLLRAANSGKVSVGGTTLALGHALQNGVAGDVIEMIKNIRATA